MVHQNSQQNNDHHDLQQSSNSLTPSLTAQLNNQQQQANQASNNNSNNVAVILSQPLSLVSSQSSISTASTNSQVKTEDELFDKIEDILCDYMRQPDRHYLHCRVLRWGLEEDQSRLFTAVVIINPPTIEN